MKKNSLLSVIIPVYNAEKYLQRAMDSLVGQTVFPDMEIIAIDDGSNDKSGSILDNYACQYPNIYIYHIPNGGVSNARNLGLAHASAEYIGFLDADDWVDADHFGKLLAGIKNCEADIAACGFVIETNDGVIVKNDIPVVQADYDGKTAVKAFLLGQIDVHAVTKLYRAELLWDIRFDSSLHYGEDRLFALSALLAAKKIALVNGCCYHYYLNSQSAMQQTVSERSFENLVVGNKTIEYVKQTYPELVPYAECEDVSVKCRILGEIIVQHRKTQYWMQYRQLRQDIRNFNPDKMYRYASKKHFLSFMVAQISPYLYGKLRSIPFLRFKK